MRSRIHILAVLAAVAAASGTPLRADVQTQEKTHVQFAGALGRMVNMFGGKAAKEGIVQTIAVKGDRMMTTNDKTAELVDLAEEKVYHIDLDAKSYKVVTFAEMRQKMQEEQAKAKEQMDASKEKQEKPPEPQKKMAVDVSTKETGQKKTINGFDCKEVISTVTMHEDGKTLEQSGGMVMTTDAWMTAPIPAMKEVAAFRKRYFEKLYGMDMQAAATQMAQAFAMYPQLKDLMSRSRVEGSRVDGTPISSAATIETVQSPEQKQQQAEQDKQQETSGGIGGMLAHKMMKKHEQSAQGSGDSSRSQLMTSTMEVLSVATSVTADAVTVPAGFKQKN
jgi:hypothetical protein